MVSEKVFLVLDVGTSGVKALAFNRRLDVLTRARKPLELKTPRRGWVEQDPQEILDLSVEVLRAVLKEGHIEPKDVMKLGLTNQRETVVAWNRKTGEPLYPAIVWQDTRTTRWCRELAKKYNDKVLAKTGLPLDPYFSASKIHWLIKNVPEAGQCLGRGQLAVGTIDSWLLWNLIEGRPVVIDETNAARTLLYNVASGGWDADLLKWFGVLVESLPTVCPSKFDFGDVRLRVAGLNCPVAAVCGDQQASAFAAGTMPGTTKITFGTGTFITQVLGSEFVCRPGFFTTLMPGNNLGEKLYVLETKVGKHGHLVDAVLNKPKELEELLTQVARETCTYLKKLPVRPEKLIVDGGISQSEFLLSELSRLSGLSIKRQKIFDGTALGAAKLLLD